MSESSGLTASQREVLRLCGVPRRTGDIVFLYGERRSDSTVVLGDLEQLAARGLVEAGSDRLWRQTDAGVTALHASDTWSARVDDVLGGSGLGRPRVACTIVLGVVYVGDWFRCEDNRIGHVLSVESPWRGLAAPGSVVLTADIELGPGDVLHSHQPLAAG